MFSQPLPNLAFLFSFGGFPRVHIDCRVDGEVETVGNFAFVQNLERLGFQALVAVLPFVFLDARIVALVALAGFLIASGVFD